MNKKVLGFLAFAPLIIDTAAIFSSVFSVIIGTGELAAMIGLVLPLTMILAQVAMIVLIIEACKNPAFTDDKKLFWGIILFLFGTLVHPFFWNKYIRKYEAEDDFARNVEASQNAACFYSKPQQADPYAYQQDMESQYEIPTPEESRYEAPVQSQVQTTYYMSRDNGPGGRYMGFSVQNVKATDAQNVENSDNKNVYYSRPVKPSVPRREVKPIRTKESIRMLIWAFLPGIFFIGCIWATRWGVDLMKMYGEISDACAAASLVTYGFYLIFRLIVIIKYIIYMSKNSVHDGSMKACWGIFIILFSSITCPLYYFAHVRCKGTYDR